jgi:hypothetical protein
VTGILSATFSDLVLVVSGCFYFELGHIICISVALSDLPQWQAFVFEAHGIPIRGFGDTAVELPASRASPMVVIQVLKNDDQSKTHAVSVIFRAWSCDQGYSDLGLPASKRWALRST